MMSISGLGGGFSAFAAMGVNHLRGRGGEDVEGDVAAVRKDGLTAFAKNAKKEAWEEKLKQWRAEVLGAMGLTEDRLAAMAPDARAQIERQIEEAVQRKIQDAMDAAQEEGKRKAQQGQISMPQFVDISV